MIGLNLVYGAAGIVFAIFALLSARDRRLANAAFFALVALSFLAGDRLGDVANGVLVLTLVAIAASGRMKRAAPAAPAEDRLAAAAALSGLWLWHDFLDASHTISQAIDTADGSLWHAIMHRREGDFSNAKYWYRKVGEHPAYRSIAAKVDAICAYDGSLEQA